MFSHAHLVIDRVAWGGFSRLFFGLALGLGELGRANYVQFTPAPLSSKEVQQPASGFTSLGQVMLGEGAADAERVKASARRTISTFIFESKMPFQIRFKGDFLAILSKMLLVHMI